MRKRTVVGTLLIILVTLLLTVLPAVAADWVVTIDIKPCKDQDPDVINVNAAGWLVPVELPVAIKDDWKLVDRETVELEDQPVLEWHEKEEYLLAKFDTDAVIDTFGDVRNGDELELCLTGDFVNNGGSFEVCDNVIILEKGNQ